MAKYCKDCGELTNNTFSKYCKDCYYDWISKKPKKIYEIKKTPIKQIGEKRKNRIKQQGSEMDVFVEIWLERLHICENCGLQINLFHPSCFAHHLNKRDHPDLRYDKNNINLVHGIFEIKDQKTGLTYNCHKELDLKLKKI